MAVNQREPPRFSSRSSPLRIPTNRAKKKNKQKNSLQLGQIREHIGFLNWSRPILETFFFFWLFSFQTNRRGRADVFTIFVIRWTTMKTTLSMRKYDSESSNRKESKDLNMSVVT